MLVRLKNKAAQNFAAIQQYYNQQLTQAIKDNKLENVKKYLSQGADINSTTQDEFKEIPLIILATTLGHRDIVEYLLQQPGINIGVTEKSLPEYAPHYPEYQDTAILKATRLCCLTYYNQIQKPLNSHIEILKLLLKAGADINCRGILNNMPGCTPLMIAANCGNLELVKFLVNAGADINATPPAINYKNFNAITCVENELKNLGLTINARQDFEDIIKLLKSEIEINNFVAEVKKNAGEVYLCQKFRKICHDPSLYLQLPTELLLMIAVFACTDNSQLPFDIKYNIAARFFKERPVNRDEVEADQKYIFNLTHPKI